MLTASTRLRHLLVAALLAGCGGDVRDTEQAVVTRLPGGGTHVHNPSTGLWDREPERRWRLVEEYRLGQAEGTGPETFGRVTEILEDPLGRLWVEDYSANEIRIFDRDGAYVRTVGRRGSGPGEFSRLGQILLGPDGNIWVDDAGGMRWEVFDTSGVRVAGHTLVSNVGSGVRAWTPDRRLVEVLVERIPGGEVSSTRMHYLTRLLQSDGSLLPADTFAAPEQPEPQTVTFTRGGEQPFAIRRRLPLAAASTTLLSVDGDLWLSDGDGSYAFRRQTLLGDTLLMVEREYTPVPAGTEALRTAREEMIAPEGMTSSDNDPSRIPTVHPPFVSLHPATDSTVWIVRTVAPDTVALEVFDREGIYLGVPEATIDLQSGRIAYVTRERLYVVGADELGVQSLIIYRIERP